MLRSPPTRTPLAAAVLLAAAGVFACGSGEGSGADEGATRGDRPVEAGADTAVDAPHAGPDTAAGGSPSQAVAFTVREAVLVRRADGGERPLLALDSASAPEGVPAVPASWRPSPDATFGVRATAFRHVVPSPEGRWVAWEAGSTHDLVGVVPADGGPPTVLDFYFDSSAEELSWAPGGRYLAARYLPPSGYAEVRLYDAETGSRLRPPWEEACRPRDGCRVTGAEWTGTATLRVTTSDGEERRREVDVAGLPERSSGGR